jgi:hypothetical protein
MGNYKELWFVRHPEVVTPDSYDFDLSRQGKRHARMLGWYVAAHQLIHPVVLLRTRSQQAETMADIIANSIKQLNSNDKEIDQVLYSLPTNSTRGFVRLIAMVNALDQMPDRSPEQMPNTAIFITHALHEEAFKLFSFVMQKLRTLNLSNWGAHFSGAIQPECQMGKFFGCDSLSTHGMNWPSAPAQLWSVKSLKPSNQPIRPGDAILRLQQPSQQLHIFLKRRVIGR